MSTSRTHIIKRGDGWAVKKQGAAKASRVFPTQDAAIKSAKNMKSASEIVIHRRDGSIRNWIKEK